MEGIEVLAPSRKGAVKVGGAGLGWLVTRCVNGESHCGFPLRSGDPEPQAGVGEGYSASPFTTPRR